MRKLIAISALTVMVTAGLRMSYPGVYLGTRKEEFVRQEMIELNEVFKKMQSSFMYCNGGFDRDEWFSLAAYL